MEATIPRHLKQICPIGCQAAPVKILDGNARSLQPNIVFESGSACTAAYQRSLVVLSPSLMLAVDAYSPEDGHAPERSLLVDVLAEC